MSDIVKIGEQIYDLDALDISRLDSLAALLVATHRAESFATTLRLWLVARALVIHGESAVQQVLIEALGYSPSMSAQYINVARVIGEDKFRTALERGSPQPFDVWIALASHKDDEERMMAAYEDALAHGVDSVEIAARARNVTPEEYLRMRALAKITKAIEYARRLGVSDDQIRAVLMETGLIPREVRSAGFLRG
ncbi:MAG: hypothetical protein RML84_09085 [Anaerolineae bacterium]|nr:hypothetical protein [Anaerolineae bacterium]